MPCRLPGNESSKYVSEDVLSYLCTLAMQKCSKKSEKKRASCGGAAMRKRLLIKNFVAQMLQQQKPLSHIDEGLDFTYEELRMEDEEEAEPTAEVRQVEQGTLDISTKKMATESDSDEEVEDDDEDDDEEEDEDEDEVSEEEEDEEDDDLSTGLCGDSNALSMVHRSMDYYGESSMFYPEHSMSQRTPTPLPAASTLCSGNSSLNDSIWSDDNSDNYSLLSLSASGSMSRSFCDPMIPTQDENMYYPSSYGAYMTPGGICDNTHTTVSFGAFMAVEQGGPNDGFIEELDMCDKLDKLNNGFVEDEVSLSNGTCFTSLVSMNSPVKVSGNVYDDPSGLLAYRRSITDLDTNTVVEEDDFTTDGSSTPSTTSSTRSPKKRPLPFAQSDDLYNLTLPSGPCSKRLKL